MHKKKGLQKTGRAIFILFLLINMICAIHAWKFTHFSKKGERLEELKLTASKKIQLLFTGIDNPRPVNSKFPAHPYKTIKLESNVSLECWLIPSPDSINKGTVILFHGYTSNKSALIERAEAFIQNGYSCMLVDFMGSGGSDGNETTIGYKEAEEVNTCFNYVRDTIKGNVYLLGSSMGAAAIMKAVNDYHIQPKAIILECPYARLYNAIAMRFAMFHVPAFPLAGIMQFWGGIENGFWGFSLNPVDYASQIKCPVLMQYGAKDDRVARHEIDEIFGNITSPKKLIIYPLAGHDDYLKTSKDEWSKNVVQFFNEN